MFGGVTGGGEGEDSGQIRNVVEGDVSGLVLQVGNVYLTPGREGAPEAPRRLPPPPFRLVNRESELALLDRVLEHADSAPGPVVAVLTGMHGVGKSAVGKHWSNGVRDRFAGGDLFGDFSLRRDSGEVDVSDVLGDFIRELGAADAAVPPTLRERAGLFKDLTASRRLLMLLDDVGDAAQVKALLPSGPGSVVVVTSNSHLEELLYDGAELVPLDPLDDETAERLLTEFVGLERLQREPDAVGDLISVCAGLPIALCVCGASMKIHRDQSVAQLVDSIGDGERRLRMVSGKGSTSVERVFDFAYGDLSEAGARLYRRLGVFPGSELTSTLVAVLMGTTVEQAEEGLSTLTDRHLIEPLLGERFRLHDLVRIHSRRCARADEAEVDREAAVRRLVDWYYAALCAADRALIVNRLRLAEPAPVPEHELPEFSSRREVFAWFDRERANLAAIVEAAAERRWEDRVWPMGEAMWLFFYNRKPFSEWIEVTTAAVSSARRNGEAAAEGRMRALLSRAHLDLRDFEAANLELSAAENAANHAQNPGLRASIGEFRGVYHLNRDEFEAAIKQFERSREVYEREGEDRGVAIQDYHLGLARTKSGDAAAAIGPLESSVATMRELDDEINIARTLLHLGRARRLVGDLVRAAEELEEAIAIAAPLGIRHTEAEAYEELAAIAMAQRQTEKARELKRRAYLAYREIAHPRAAELVQPGSV